MKYTRFKIKGRTILNPDGIRLNAVIQCDRPVDAEEMEQLLSDHGALFPVEKPVEAFSITDEKLRDVEELVGMSCGAWDCVNPKEIIAAVLNVYFPVEAQDG